MRFIDLVLFTQIKYSYGQRSEKLAHGSPPNIKMQTLGRNFCKPEYTALSRLKTSAAGRVAEGQICS